MGAYVILPVGPDYPVGIICMTIKANPLQLLFWPEPLYESL